MMYPLDILLRNLQSGFMRRILGRSERTEQVREIIHDLVNPLTVINLSMERLQDGLVAGNAEARRHVAAALRASRKMRQFLANAKARLQTKEQMPLFDIALEIDAAVKLMRPLSKKAGVRIKFRSKRAVFISGDRVLLFRIASNLISNAIDSYAHLPISRNKVVIVRVGSENGRVVLSVRDFGCGIPKSLRKKIFEPFYTTKERRDGAGGLGLSIVKNIIEKDFGGRIKLESSAGRGSTFKLVIPV